MTGYFDFTKHRSLDEVSEIISSRLSVTRNLTNFTKGLAESYTPRSKQEYDQYRRFMHDVLCFGLLNSGFADYDTLTLEKIGITTENDRIRMMKPDLYTVSEDLLHVVEVSFSFDSSKSMTEKSTKYQELFDHIHKYSKYQVNYKIIIVDLTDTEWESLIPGIAETYLTLLRKLVDNLILFHSTPHGRSFRDEDIDFGSVVFPFEHNIGQSSLLIQRLCGNASLIDVSGYCKQMYDPEDDDAYLDAVANSILDNPKASRPFPCDSAMNPVHLIEDYDKMRSVKKNTDNTPVVLQLGAPTLTSEQYYDKKSVISQIMESNHYGGYVDLIKTSIESSSYDPESNLISLSLTEAQLENEMLQGPGRKKYLKNKGVKMARSAPKHIGISANHESLLQDLISIIDDINPSDYIDEMGSFDNGTSSNISSVTFERMKHELYTAGASFLLRFYQRVSEEIILNSMKRRKKREYILVSSGFDNVYILIAPGAQLRTESNVVFVKIISFIPCIQHKLSASWHSIGSHWESDWISVDTDRLKHWCRAFDRVALSVVGVTEKLVEPGLTITQALRSEIKLGNYSLMSMIYLENKASTSTTIQTTRYLLMKSLGDKMMKGLMAKFPQRISSVLQSVIVQRAVRSSILICQTNLQDMLKQNQIIRDDELDSLDETSTGVVGKVPRLFTMGANVPIHYSLNEIYYCMMYNKDRQNPTQDSMKILTKILNEELKLEDELSQRSEIDKVNHMFGVHPLSEDLSTVHSTSRESHYYSRHAVEIAYRLQNRHRDNVAPNSGWLTINKIRDILSKNLSEYATFKASVKDIIEQIQPDDMDHIKKIGSRTKCIELMYEIVNDENLSMAYEVAMQYSGENNDLYRVLIQIFKKNQVGGVREILILYIKARILINITEEICRLLAKSDKREILTKGRDKRLMMRGDYEDLSSSFVKGTPLSFIKNSYDMSTWCQKFIPTIFMGLSQEHSRALGPVKQFFDFIMIRHCSKEIEMPRKLIEQWSKHPEMVHDVKSIQEKKKLFIDNGITKFVNKSNMGQGILHYASTTIALAIQSLRDKLFERCLYLLRQDCCIKWRTRVGSDDKGDIIALDLTNKHAYAQAALFDQCSHVAEVLCDADLSVKSASGHILYELNSAYMANLEVLSPIIKFSMAAVDMIGTDSCTKFVNESYSRIRQMRENGASSLLCGMAHVLNRDHFNKIFAVGDGDVNCPADIFGTKSSLVPYDFGVYPFFDIDLHEMVGPEFHNYLVYTSNKANHNVIKFLYTNLKDVTENFIPAEDEGLYKKEHFNIMQGVVKQLHNMRNRLNLDGEQIMNYLRENPFMMIRGPITPKETKMIIGSKLFTRGASDSLRRTSPVIYLGRMPAFRSARAWRLMSMQNSELLDENDEPILIEISENMTYAEYLKEGMSVFTNFDFDRKKYLHMIFPQFNSFEVIRQFTGKFGVKLENKRKFSQAIRTWTLNNYNYNFSNSLRSILLTSFGMENSSTMDDVMELRKRIPVDLTSYENLIESCRLDGIRPLDLFFYLTKFYKNMSVSKPQVFAYGPSSSSLNTTLLNIKRYNHLPNITMMIDDVIEDEESRVNDDDRSRIDILRLAFNLEMMSVQGVLRIDDRRKFKGILDEAQIGAESLSSRCESIVRNVKSINGYDQQSQKIIIFIASRVLPKDEFKECILKWKLLNYTYIQRQKKSTNGQWTGDLKVLVSSSNECYLFCLLDDKVSIHLNSVVSNDDFLRSLRSITRTMGIDIHRCMTERDVKPGDYYMAQNKLFLAQYPQSSKLRMNIVSSPLFPYRRIVDFTNFKIVTEQKKDQSITVSLFEDNTRSAELCHFPGHYYPVDIPSNFLINNDVFMNGVRCTKVFGNRSWFINGRLPPMRRKDALIFLRDDVLINRCMNVDIDTRSRIESYLDFQEDTMDEMFGILQQSTNRDYNPTSISTEVQEVMNRLNSGVNIEDLFREEVVKLTKREEFNWDEEVIDYEEASHDIDNYIETLPMMNFVSALGERKHKKRRNFYTISNLQQNNMIKNHVLDLFFKGGNVYNDDVNALAQYYFHLNNVKSELSTENRILSDNLKTHILVAISTRIGKPVDEIRDMMEKLKRRGRTLDRFDSFIDGENFNIGEVLDGIVDFQSDSDSD